MDKILFINACVRPMSRTYKLARKVLDRIGGEVTELELSGEGLEPIDWKSLQHRLEALERGELSDEAFRYAKQFSEAEQIVIAAPYWDLSFPSALKVYLEHICIVGKTFAYAEDGRPYGLCRAKRIIYVSTAGGPVLPGFDLGYEYVEKLSKAFFGIQDILRFGAEGLDMVSPEESEKLFEAAMEKVEQDERL